MSTCTKCGRKMNALVHDMCLFCVDVELTQLRGIEAAASAYCSPNASACYRLMATQLRNEGIGLTLPNVLDALANALETKNEYNLT